MHLHSFQISSKDIRKKVTEERSIRNKKVPAGARVTKDKVQIREN